MDNSPNVSEDPRSTGRPANVPVSVIRQFKRNHRFTPYQTAPRSRIIKKTRLPITDGHTTTAQDKVRIKDLVNKTWRVYRVSPLYRLSKSQQSLKSYAKSLSSCIKAQGLKGTAVDADSDIADFAQFSLNKALRLTADDHESIEITLKQKPKDRNGKERTVFWAHLLCIKEDVSMKNKGFSHLPVMIVQGALNLSDQVIGWLQSKFDCAISQMKFTPTMLSWMLALFSGYVPDKKKSKEVSLVFQVPPEINGLSKITLMLDGKRCRDLWQSVHSEENEDFTQAEVVAFIKSLEAHFHHHFKMDLEALLLQTIGTNVLYAGSVGKIKMFSEDHVFHVLRHLTDLSLESSLKPHSIDLHETG